MCVSAYGMLRYENGKFLENRIIIRLLLHETTQLKAPAEVVIQTSFQPAWLNRRAIFINLAVLSPSLTGSVDIPKQKFKIWPV